MTPRRAKGRAGAAPTRDEIKAKLGEILSDKRLRYKCATVVENAPLTLIQLDMESRAQTLCWVLGIPFVHPRLTKSRARRGRA